MAEDINPYVGRLFDLGQAFAAPLAQKIAGGKVGTEAGEKAYVDEKIRVNALNGSGPNDPNAAKDAPVGILDFITGRNRGSATGTGAISGSTMNPLWLAVIALGALLVLMQFRR
jgi:hypothetical protein